MCYKWAAFRKTIRDICNNVNALKEDDGSVKYFQHIGGGHYVSVTSVSYTHLTLPTIYSV